MFLSSFPCNKDVPLISSSFSLSIGCIETQMQKRETVCRRCRHSDAYRNTSFAFGIYPIFCGIGNWHASQTHRHIHSHSQKATKIVYCRCLFRIIKWFECIAMYSTSIVSQLGSKSIDKLWMIDEKQLFDLFGIIFFSFAAAALSTDLLDLFISIFCCSFLYLLSRSFASIVYGHWPYRSFHKTEEREGER